MAEDWPLKGLSHMTHEIPLGKHFNRREVKSALRSNSVDLTKYLKNIPAANAIRLTHQMFEELKLLGFPEYINDCMTAVNKVDHHPDDRREMLDNICRVIDSYSTGGKMPPERKINLAIATYFSISHANFVANLIATTVNPATNL
jgi:hypothetical protein